MKMKEENSLRGRAYSRSHENFWSSFKTKSGQLGRFDRVRKLRGKIEKNVVEIVQCNMGREKKDLVVLYK